MSSVSLYCKYQVLILIKCSRKRGWECQIMLTDSMDPPPASPPTFSKYWVLLHECRRPIQMHYNIWGDQCSQYRYPRGFSACTMPYGKTNIQGPQGFLLFYWGHMEDHIWYLLLLLDQLTRTLAQGVLLLLLGLY